MLPTLIALAFLIPPQAGIPADVLWPLESRLPHLRERLECPDPGVRRRALTELTCFSFRDSTLYPPLLRHLLADPSPEIRWQTLSMLDDHGVAVPPWELPASIEVPLAGTLVLGDASSLARMRGMAKGEGAGAGWAIRTLGLIGDRESTNLALALVESENVFTRHSAAVALLHFDRQTEARALLRSIAEDVKGRSAENAWYTLLAAERLVRLGETGYLGLLVELIPLHEGVRVVLEDLTGEFHATEAEWKAWRK